MTNPQEANQPDNNPSPADTTPKSYSFSPQNDQDFFCFLKNEEKPVEHHPFFSQNGLSQDIIKVTHAKPDVCLEVFYALNHTLWPQIEKQSDISFKDAGANFIGGSIMKGILCPPEKLIGKQNPTEIRRVLPQSDGERLIFHDLDQVLNSISFLKQKILDYTDELLQKEEILDSLDLVGGFYQGYRNRVKALVQAIIEKEQMNVACVSEYDALLELLEPKAVMISDIFANHWAYRIPRSKAQKLLSFDGKGQPIKNDSNEAASHRVSALPEAAEPLVYFKANGRIPIQPEKEFMLYSLYRQLEIPVPETALLILADVFENNSDYFYAVQASEAVIGTSALEACQNKETIFNQEAYTKQVIGAMLTNPSDGSLKNFKYSPKYKTLVGIDNDLVFEPEFIGEDGKVVNVKSALFLLTKMDLAILKSTKTLFTTLDPHLVVLSWLKGLSQKNKGYGLLFARLPFQKTRCIYQDLLSGKELPDLATTLQLKVDVDPALHSDSPFWPQILVSENLLSNISEKLQVIESLFLLNEPVSSQILFEEISLVLGKYYHGLRLKFPDPQEALEVLWQEKKVDVILGKERFSNESLLPEAFFSVYKSKLASGEIPPLDKFIQYQSQRKRDNLFNLRQALAELRLLVQEGLTESHSPRDIVDFRHEISTMTEAEDYLIKEMTSLLSNLPGAELKWLFTLEKHFLRDAREDLRPSSIAITGAFMKQRRFNPTGSLFDERGEIKKNTSLTGRSNVACFPEENPEFYLKQYPEFPGYEYASVLFMRMLGVAQLPYQELVMIDSKYPALLTQAVHGDPVYKVWSNPEAFNTLDPFHTGLLIIAAMLLNPEDGKEDNFILSPDRRYLIPIDNDHCFLPSTFQKGRFWNLVVDTTLQMKTLLFCLDEMNQPIPNEVRQHILSINFDSLLASWLHELVKIDHRYYHLVDEKQREIFLSHGTVLRIPFNEQYIHDLYWKANKIQDLLRSTSDQTPFSLLKAVEPFAARCHHQDGNTLESRFKAATSQLYKKTNTDGIRMSVLNTQSMVKIINTPEKDLQNDGKIGPCDALEALEKLIQERSQNKELEQGLLCELDDQNGESIWTRLFGDSGLETDLKKFFLNPKEGLSLKGSKRVTGSNIRDLLDQTPDQGTKIKFLSLPNSPLLDSETIRTLLKGCPNLEYLNVSGCPKLEEIVTVKGEWPLLARLEAKECMNLRRVVSCSPIKILRIGTNQKIEIFLEEHILDILAISTQTNEFDFSFDKGDENFRMRPLEEGASADDFLQKALLQKKVFDEYFRNPKITIGTHPSILSPNDLAVFITSLDLRTLELDHQTFKEIVQLELINLKSLQLPSLERLFDDLIQGQWPKLTHLNLSDNEITDEGFEVLSQGNWPLLKILNLSDAKITKKGLLHVTLNTNWLDLQELKPSLVRRPVEDFSNKLLRVNWHLLVELDLSWSGITQREIEAIVSKSKWPNLKLLDLSGNEITDEGFAMLPQANWSRLAKLNLMQTRVTNKGLLNFYLNEKLPEFLFIDLPSSADFGLSCLLRQRKFSQVE